MKPSRAVPLIAVTVFAFLYLPLAVTVLFSFNESPHGVQWAGFTTKWYAGLTGNTSAMTSLQNTLLLAAISTAVSTLLGTALGYSLARFKFVGRNLITRALTLPVFLPDILLAVALLLFFAVVRRWVAVAQLGIGTMIIAHITFQIPFIALMVRARLSGMDASLEEAAHDLGANSRRAFWRVTLPLMLPGICGGAMLAFTLSVDDFVISFFTTGPGAMTLPIYIYSAVKRGVTPEINALASVMIGLSASMTIFMVLLGRRSPR